MSQKRSITSEPSERQSVTGQTYRQWREVHLNVAGNSYVFATKPGLFGYGRTDPAAMLLAEHVVVKKGDVIVYMGCGNGLAAAVAARSGQAARIVATDRNVVSVEATRRTLSANGVANAEVIAGQGAFGISDDLTADVVAIRIPQEKLALIQLLSDGFRLLGIGGKCYVAGATNEGIKTAAKLLTRIFGNAAVLGYDSGHRIVAAEKESGVAPQDGDLSSPYLNADVFRELDITLRGESLTIYSRPGVFSWDHLDEATQILADNVEIPTGASVLDLGCGSGPLGIVASRLSGGGPLAMVDADVEAVRSAKKSATAAGIHHYRVIASDVAGAVIGERFDVVVTNPPFHIGKHADLSVPIQFIEDSWEVLSPGGRVFLVANRTLPYELPMKRRFGNITTLHDGQRFKVLSATKS